MSTLSKQFLQRALQKASLENEDASVPTDAAVKEAAAVSEPPTSTGDAVTAQVEDGAPEQQPNPEDDATPAANQNKDAAPSVDDTTIPGAGLENDDGVRAVEGDGAAAPAADDTAPAVDESAAPADGDVAPAEPAEQITESGRIAEHAEAAAAVDEVAGDEQVETSQDERFAEDAAFDDESDEPADIEAAERAVDIVETANDVNETREAERQIENAREGLENLRETVNLFNQNGGVNAEVMPFLNIAFESYSDIVGVDLNVGVALESLEGDSTLRLNASLEAIDSVLTRMGSAKSALVQTRKGAETKLQGLLAAMVGAPALEDIVGGDAGAEAAVFAPAASILPSESLATAVSDVEAEQLVEKSDAYGAASARVEDIRTEIVAQNEAGGMSIESIVAASLALESITKPLGLQEVKLVDSLESLTPTDRIQVSVEAFGGVEGNIKQGFKAMLTRLGQSYMRSINYLWLRAPIMSKRLEWIAGEAGLANNAKSGKVTVDAKYLHRDGQMPTDLGRYISDYAKISEIILGNFHKKAKEDFKANIESLRKAKLAKEADFEPSLNAVASGWADPRSLLTPAQLSFPTPGGRRLFADLDKPAFESDLPSVKKLSDFAYKNVPTRIFARGIKAEDGRSLGKVEINALKPAEIKATATALRAAVKSSSLFQAFVEQMAADVLLRAIPATIVAGANPAVSLASYLGAISPLYVWSFRRGAHQGLRWVPGKYKNDMKIVTDAALVSNNMRFHVGNDALATLMTVASGFIKASKASLKNADNEPKDKAE